MSLEKKKRRIFPLMKGFCLRTISYPGRTNPSCLCWAPGPYVNSASVPSFLSGSSSSRCTLLPNYNSGSQACLATPLWALSEDGAVPQGKQPSAPPSFMSERRGTCRKRSRRNVCRGSANGFLYCLFPGILGLGNNCDGTLCRV